MELRLHAAVSFTAPYVLRVEAHTAPLRHGVGRARVIPLHQWLKRRCRSGGWRDAADRICM